MAKPDQKSEAAPTDRPDRKDPSSLFVDYVEAQRALLLKRKGGYSHAEQKVAADAIAAADAFLAAAKPPLRPEGDE